ncbi:MAG: 50S ribosomal protein L10 [Anaerolineae bacterium]|nr:50S ribosomal protein L10 [Anaerolineae bacterium]
MAITRQKKQELVADYLDKIGRAEMIIITDYRGLTVKQMQELRRSLSPHDAQLQVTKNSLFRRALQEAGKPVPEDMLAGTTAVGYCFSDFGPAAKAIKDFADSSDILQIRGGLLGDQILSADEVKQLAGLPPRDVLLAQVLAGMQGPISGLVNVLGGVLRGFVNVLDARRRQLEEAAA